MLHVQADAECAVAVLWMHVLVHGMWWVGVGGGLVLAGCICALGWGIIPVWTIMGGNGCTLANADAIGHGVAALLVDWMCCGLLVLAMGWLCSA